MLPSSAGTAFRLYACRYARRNDLRLLTKPSGDVHVFKHPERRLATSLPDSHLVRVSNDTRLCCWHRNVYGT